MILPQRRSDQRELKERLHVFAISATTSAQILKASKGALSKMWEVSKVGPQNGGWGFNIITTQGKKPLVSFAYKTEAEAKQAAAKVWPVIANAISVTPHVIVR